MVVTFLDQTSSKWVWYSDKVSSLNLYLRGGFRFYARRVLTTRTMCIHAVVPDRKKVSILFFRLLTMISIWRVELLNHRYSNYLFLEHPLIILCWREKLRKAEKHLSVSVCVSHKIDYLCVCLSVRMPAGYMDIFWTKNHILVEENFVHE